MRFGLGPCDLGLSKSEKLSERYSELLDEGALAQETGFDSIWIGENHFGREAICTSAETVAAALATRTEGIRIAIIPALALANPLYIAEDVAVLDNISNGRVIVAARQPHPHELAQLGIKPKETADRFTEAFEVLRKAWAPAGFSHRGKYWNVPGQDFSGNPFAKGVTTVNVVPKPPQLTVPLWVFCWDKAAVGTAAALGAPWVGSPFDTMEELSQKQATYRAQAGSAATGNLLVPAVREVYLGETMKEARADAEKGLLELYRTYRDIGLIDHPVGDFDSLARDRFIIGDVDHVIETITRYQREAGVNYLICRMRFPGMTHQKARAAIKFFGQAVIPEFRMDSFPGQIRKRSRQADAGEQA